jgi:hypothetical protein
MTDELPPFSLVVSMRSNEASTVSEMFKMHPDFSAIRMTVNSDRATYGSDQQIPEGYVWTTIEIPRATNMIDFYGEFCKALHQESTVAMQRERER